MVRTVLACMGMGCLVCMSLVGLAEERAPLPAAHRYGVKTEQVRARAATGEVRKPGAVVPSVRKSRTNESASATTSRQINLGQADRRSKTDTVLTEHGAVVREEIYAGTLTVPTGHTLFKAWPFLRVENENPRDVPTKTSQSLAPPRLVDQRVMNTLLMSGEQLGSVGNLPATASPSEGMHVSEPASALTAVPASLTRRESDEGFRCLEMEVSHSGHILKLYRHSYSGKKDLLHECRVGLGSPGFPTPVGEYYVTHIYDQTPWWIPPPDRAWAAGQSRSKSVYGGTMAPLLKKRQARSSKKEPPLEDKIEDQVTLNDYGYRFHGTNAPRSIGRNQSHGCVRMLPDDAKRVASLIKDYVGVKDRKEAVNGSFAILNNPVRLNLVR